MSASRSSQDLSGLLNPHAARLKLEIWPQYGHPWWPFDPWLSACLQEAFVGGRYRARPRRPPVRKNPLVRRWPERSPEERLKEELMEKAAQKRKSLLDPAYDGPKEMTWEPFFDLLAPEVEPWLIGEATDERQNVNQRRDYILGALEFAQNKLTKRRKQVFHLRGILDLPEAHCATLLKVEKKTVGSHLCQAWGQLKTEGCDTDGLAAFLKDMGIGARRPEPPSRPEPRHDSVPQGV
ncbi:hypothetical protein [Streptomyces sp. T028]|uniref:hypothetical protein n=1 Tax=Streptomyces sp. T028 TaxID=3394379 RepID=UPI003A85F9D6